MGGAVFLPCWLFGLRPPSSGAYGLLGGARSPGGNGGLQEGWRQWVLARTTTPSVFVTAVSHSLTLNSTGDHLILTVRSGPVSYEVTAFFPGSCCTRDLVCTLQEWSFCFPSIMEFLWSNPAGLQSQILWGLLLFLPGTNAGKSDMGSGLLFLWENFCGIIIFQFVGRPHGRCEIWFYRDCALPTVPSLLLCLWM